MNAASFLQRFGRAIVTVTVVLAAAGLLSALSLPSDIYPPLVFPRVVAIAHSGSLPAQTMSLTVTTASHSAFSFFFPRFITFLLVVS